MVEKDNCETSVSEIKCDDKSIITEKDHPLMNDLRNKALEYAEQNPNDFEKCDIELLKTKNYWINRFLNFRDQSFDDAFKHLVETFKWRKDFELNTFDYSIAPLEAWLSGAAFVYLPDKFGNPVIYLRAKMHHKIEEKFYRLFQKLLMLQIDRADRLANKEFGWSVCLDLNNVGWQNVDLEMLHFLLNTTRSRYPNGCKFCYVYGLPWFLSFIAKGIFAALPSDSAAKVKFVSGSNYKRLSIDEIIEGEKSLDDNNNIIEKDETTKKLPLEEFIDIKNIPDFLGGKAKLNYRKAPIGTATAMKIGKTKFDLTEAQINNLMKPFQKIATDALELHKQYLDKNYDYEFNSIEEHYSRLIN